MTLLAAVDDLWQAVHRLRDGARTLELITVEDHPRGASVKIIDDLADAATALSGWVAEVQQFTASACTAAGGRCAVGLADALDPAGATLARIVEHTLEEFASCRRLSDIDDYARRSSREARAWVANLKETVDGLTVDLWATQQALTGCWRELADRVVTGDVSVSSGTSERST